MSKHLLALACVSTFGLSGCIGLIGLGVSAVAESGKGDRAEKEELASIEKQLNKLEDKYSALPEDLAELEEAHNDWDGMYGRIETYRASEEFANKHVGSCYKSKDRAKGDHCKKAAQMADKVAHKIADIFNAAIEADPEVGSKFPLWDIAYAQRFPALAKVVDVADSLGRLTDRMNAVYAKRVKKAGGTERLARKENKGVCFFSEDDSGDIMQPQFMVSGNADELHIRCAAVDALSSFDRSEKDVVDVDLVNQVSRFTVVQLPGDGSSDSPTYTNEVSMAKVRKTMKAKDRDADDDAKPAKPWRFAIVEVSYMTSRKVGTSARHVGDQVQFDDQIATDTIATGLLVVDMEAAASERGDDHDDDDVARDEDSSDDDSEREERVKVVKIAKADKKKKRKAKRK